MDPHKQSLHGKLLQPASSSQSIPRNLGRAKCSMIGTLNVHVSESLLSLVNSIITALASPNSIVKAYIVLQLSVREYSYPSLKRCEVVSC